MIQKTIVMKAAAAVIGAAAIAGTVMAVRHMSEVKDTYRSILLYEIEGTAEIEREGTGKFNGTENLYLESGDQLTVEAESFTRLRLDEDKYVMVEENSALSIEAAGTMEDSRTRLNLTKGAIVNEIRNPLSAGSTYEVTTPNSIMAVRGTIFRVEVYYDENGEIFTKVSVFEGKVSSRLIYPDGTMEEEVITGNGKEVIIHSNQELTEYLGEERDIKYDELPEDILRVIQGMMNGESMTEGIAGEEPGISKAAESTKQERSGETAEDTEEEKDREEETVRRESGAGEKTEESRVREAMPSEEGQAAPKTAEESSMALTETTSSGQAENGPGSESGSSEESRGGGSSGGGSFGGGGSSGNSQTEERPTENTTEAPTETPGESSTEAPTETPAESSTEAPTETPGESSTEAPTETPGESSTEAPTETPGESSTEAPTETSGESSTETPEESSTEPSTEESTEAPTEPSTEAPTEPAEYTVTFMYNGEVYGIQQIKEGQCAAEPWLRPSNTGNWDFNFDDPITGNMTIQWNSGG